MPTLHRFNGYRVFVPTNDHRPAHVHVEKAGNEAVFLLGCPAGPVSLRGNFGFKLSELNEIEEELNTLVERFCIEWEQIHGQP